MNTKKDNALHIAKKNQLFALIRRIGELNKEDPDFLKEYIADVYTKYKNDLDTAIMCFEDVLKNMII